MIYALLHFSQWTWNQPVLPYWNITCQLVSGLLIKHNFTLSWNKMIKGLGIDFLYMSSSTR